MKINFVSRLWTSFGGGILSLWIATECFIGFAHKMSEGVVLTGVALIGAISFVAFLGATVIFVYSIIGIMGNIDRMSKEAVKSWEEEMQERRVKAKQKREREAKEAAARGTED